jgi:hypothetical protein
MFGASTGSDNLDGKSGAYIASLFQSRFVVKEQKLDAEVRATALAIYVTAGTLDSTGVGTHSGFLVGGNGVATATFNVGTNGAAFGVADNTTMTVMDLLLAANAQSINDVLYNGSTVNRKRPTTSSAPSTRRGTLTLGHLSVRGHQRSYRLRGLRTWSQVSLRGQGCRSDLGRGGGMTSYLRSIGAPSGQKAHASTGSQNPSAVARARYQGYGSLPPGCSPPRP